MSRELVLAEDVEDDEPWAEGVLQAGVLHQLEFGGVRLPERFERRLRNGMPCVLEHGRHEDPSHPSDEPHMVIWQPIDGITCVQFQPLESGKHFDPSHG